ncbi:MAG: benzylsuccinate synthase gamma subunit family protein [Thermodesulfobacteriota bacterium]
MAICSECSKFFPLNEEPDKGDCVRRVVDPRQAYHTAKPVDADQEADDCRDFQRKP